MFIHMSRMPYEKICLCCNTSFVTFSKKQKFCSRSCYSKWQSDHMKGENNHNYISTKPLKQCLNCKKKFYHPDKTRKFCSVKCVGKYYSHDNSPVRNKNLKVLLCPVCKKEFRQKRITQECCSKECKHLLHSSKMTGKNNPAYTTGSSFGVYCEKFNREFKKRVKKFYNNRCVICNSTNQLIVHHVYENPDACCNTDELNKAKFVTLCRSCHFTYHQNKKFNNESIVSKFNLVFDKIIKSNNGKTYLTKEEYYLIKSKED